LSPADQRPALAVEAAGPARDKASGICASPLNVEEQVEMDWMRDELGVDEDTFARARRDAGNRFLG